MKPRFALFAAFALLAAPLAACDKPGSVMDEIAKQDKEEAAKTAAAEAANATFLNANKAKPGVMTTASGLQYEIVRAGDATAPAPGPADTVSVMYEGKLVSGKVFDSAYARGAPAQFEVGGVIPGWTEALQLMHPGAEFQLVLPPNIAYGAQDNGDIPPNSVLVFKVELLGYRTPAGKVYGKF
jgi:FKBP-type peptidyl-prolyl cis-trans isomerase